MRRIRFTIGTLLVLVFFLGISFAALREASPIWDGAILCVTIGAILVSILLAVHRAGTKRAFWLGFALFGSTYLGLTVVPSLESRLISTQALVFLDSKIPERPLAITGQVWGNPPNGPPVVFQSISSGGGFVSRANNGTFWLASAPGGGRLGAWGGTSESFIRIGQSLLALVAAGIGGLCSRHLHARAGHVA
jgi:hypothetical protein